MRVFDFLFCYDIADEKRLKKVAKVMENSAIRIQYSVFFYPDATKLQIQQITTKLIDIIDEEVDDIRIYQVDIKRSFFLNSGIDLKNPTIIAKG